LYFSDIEHAIRAKEQGHGLEIDGASVRTDYSFTKRPHNPTPGRYMGHVRRPRYGYDRGYYRRSPPPYDDRYRRSPPPYDDRYRRPYNDRYGGYGGRDYY
jgi:transformer-2 protein